MELSAGELGMYLLMKSKKAAGFLEVNYLFTGLMFFFVFGLVLNMIIPEDEIEEKTFETVLEDLTEEMGAVTGGVVATILSVGSLIFSIFGVSLISSVGVLPLWFSTLLSLYASIIVIFSISWFITWIGNVIPFT